MALETTRFMGKHGLTAYQRNPHFPVNTLNLMRAATAASLDGHFEHFMEAAFHHMWEEPKKMDDPSVMREALEASGLDANHLMARVQDGDVKARLMASTQRAVERGAFGAPTFFVDEEMFYGKDQLRDVEEEIATRLTRKR